MKYFLFLFFIYLWSSVCCESTTKRDVLTELARGVNTAAAKLTNIVKESPVLQNIFPSYCVTPPKECPNENVTFWYYSRSKSESPVQLHISNPESFSSLQRNQHPWKIIIHGYTKSKDEIPNPQLRSAYFKRGDYNLISVDYSPLARDKCYIQAVDNAALVAKCTSQMIDNLIERGFLKSENLHVIGFSLGAQIAGLIHEYMTNKKPSRVTGLDPAAPLFDGETNNRLTHNAGDFVDVIHTNALFKGKLETSGHVDFYVNGGLNQPGCMSDEEKSLSTCNHDRSPLYFAESINSDEGFWGIPCESYLKFYSGFCNTNDSELVQMGEFVPNTARGTYYLETKSEAPFALGKVSEKL